MKLNALWILFLLVPVLSADALVTCNSGAASVPIFNPASTSGAVGDYTLTCTGGVPTPSGDAIPVENFTAFMNVSILNTGGWILTDGVNMTPGSFGPGNVVDFVGVPFNPPGAGSVVFTVENVFVNPSAQVPGFQFNEDLALNGDVAVEIAVPEQLVAENAVPEPGHTGVLLVGLAALIFAARKSATAA